MKRLAVGLLLAMALIFGPGSFTPTASAAQSPVFGSANVALLTTDAAKKVTAKGYYANYYGSLALTYLYYGYLYQYYAYYYNGAYGYYAAYYGSYGANYASVAYFAWAHGL